MRLQFCAAKSKVMKYPHCPDKNEERHTSDADPASQPVRIGKVYESKLQFEEAVQELLKQYEQAKPAATFY